MTQADVAAPDVATPPKPEAITRCTSEKIPKVTNSSTGHAAARIDLRGNQQDVAQDDAQEQIPRTLPDSAHRHG
jgi:hypothetical protein